MTSPVDTSVKHYTSAVFPSLAVSAAVGSLLSMLRLCLVTGFGAQAPTSVVVSGGVATATFPSAFPSAVDMVVLVSGADGAWTNINGEQKLVSIGTNLVRFATALPDGTATGSISIKIAPAGWTEVFTGTNVAVFKSPHLLAHGGGMYLRVNDTGTTIARVVGYEAMSDVDTGTGSFPTAAQVSGGGYWTKGTAAGATAIPWALFADSRTFYLHLAPGVATNAAYVHGVTRGFGDLIALRPSGDAFATFLNSSITATVANQYQGALDNPVAAAADATTVLARAYTGLGSAEQAKSRAFIGAETAVSGVDALCGSFPNPIDGALMLSRRYCASETSGNAPRGILPGFYTCPQSGVYNSLKLFGVVPGSGDLADRRLMAVNPANVALTSAATAATAGASFIDITGPWR